MNVFEKIREKLEAEKMKHFLTIANTGDDKLDFAYEKVGNALDGAIKIVNQAEAEYREKKLSEHCHDCKEYDKDKHHCPRFCEVIKSTVEEIKEGYNNGWIPVEERLPEMDENKKYLVCGNKGGVYIAEFVCKTIDGGTKIGPWWSAKGRYCPKPIAWQPLPEPYQKGE